MSTYRIPVRISRETPSLPKEKTYSYHEVEGFLCQVINTLTSTELIVRNNLNVKCVPDCKDRGVMVTIRQGDEYGRFMFLIER